MCRPGSGSFVRPKKLNTGVTFPQAVRQRYGAEPAAATGVRAGDDVEEEMFVAGEARTITKDHMIAWKRDHKRNKGAYTVKTTLYKWSPLF